jgi:hypothetical protein
MKHKPLSSDEMLRILNDYQIRYSRSESQYYIGKRKVTLQTLAIGLQNLGFKVPEVWKMVDKCKISCVTK